MIKLSAVVVPGTPRRAEDGTSCGWRYMDRNMPMVKELLHWAQLNTCADMTKVGISPNFLLECRRSPLYRSSTDLLLSARESPK